MILIAMFVQQLSSTQLIFRQYATKVLSFAQNSKPMRPVFNDFLTIQATSSI